MSAHQRLYLSVLSVALLAALGLCPIAQAEPSRELERNAAAHFEKGVELYREGSLDASLVEFERAYDLIPNYRLLYNLAQIQAERHEYVTAAGLFERYLAAGGVQIPEARRSEAALEIQKLRTRIAQLSVESNASGARLFVNDVQVGTLPLSQPVPINSGVCEVRLEKAGYVPASQRLKVAGGEQPKLTLNLVTSERARALEGRGSAREPNLDMAAESANPPSYLPFWISSATTLALGSATLGLGLTARAADHDLDAALRRFPANEHELSHARSQLKLYAGLTDAFAAVSIVGVGLALYFLLDPPRSAAHAGKEPARSARILPSERGIGLRATF